MKALRSIASTLATFIAVACAATAGAATPHPHAGVPADAAMVTVPATLPPAPAPNAREARPMVAIYEFRSGVSEIGARAATDMFITALMQTGRFRVMERARLNEGVVREKQLNASAASTGDIGGQQLHGVRYLFEGTLSEANASQDQRASGVNLGGMEIGGGRNRDAIAIDVRVVDASTGEIMDVVTVRRNVDATQSGISGMGNLISAAAAMHGRPIAIVPDVHVQNSHRDSVDAAVRSAIEEAVAKLGDRFAQ
jgi:curli biogenesis system outer membrane secretion channel CsgG